jgi:predicted HicB family RNase H-like nuclease
MKTLQEQYNLLKEGKGHKGTFMKEAKRQFPNIVHNAATFEQTAKALKRRSIISENIFPLLSSSGLNPFTSFDKFLNEEDKSTKKKATKKANEQDTKGWDYQDRSLLDNINPDQLQNGVELEIRKDPSMPLEKAIEIVVKQLGKDPMYYIKNAAFGVEGIGYTDEAISLTPKDIKGKYISSGYGDLKENNMKKSEQLKELLEEAVAGIPSIGNPFAERSQTGYEAKFEAYLAENARTDAEEEGYLDGMKDEKEDLDEDARTDAEEEGYLDGMKDEKKDKKKEAKKEGRMGMKDVMKEAKRLGEMARKRVEGKIYERAISERKSALMVNEDESISEFINQAAVQSVQREVALLEKKLMEVNADANTMG